MSSKIIKFPVAWQRAFTLIELLVVVAIIALLASIAIPNFLEAQTRAKVSRAWADLNTLNTAIETYRTEWNSYMPTPVESLTDRTLRLVPLTTPIAYITSLPMEVFRSTKVDTSIAPYAYWSAKLSDAMKFSPIYFYLPDEKARSGRWTLFSRSPDGDYESAVEEEGSGLLMHYDATNGTVSNGDLMKCGP